MVALSPGTYLIGYSGVIDRCDGVIRESNELKVVLVTILRTSFKSALNTWTVS